MIFLQSPPKGATIPYRPKPQVSGPLILAGGQAYTIQGNYAVPAHGDVSTMPLFSGVPGLPPPPSPLLHHHHTGLADPMLKNGHLSAALPPAHLAAAVDVSREQPPKPTLALHAGTWSGNTNWDITAFSLLSSWVVLHPSCFLVFS